MINVSACTIIIKYIALTFPRADHRGRCRSPCLPRPPSLSVTHTYMYLRLMLSSQLCTVYLGARLINTEALHMVWYDYWDPW